MSNDTESHTNGVSDETAAAAALIASTPATDSAAEAPAAEAATDAPAAPKPTTFDDLGLHPDIKQALDDMGYTMPTAVQATVFKPVSEGKDLLVQSRTGTGKTTAFGLPIINKLVPTHRQPQALILAPTRELAIQVARELTAIGKHRGIVIEPIYGGAPIGTQITNLKNGVHIVVGTPGRVLDHIGRGTLDTSAISTFILDECDEMLSMGFLEDIERVVKALPEKKQTLLFSATMPDEVSRYARRHMRAPEQISLSRDQVSVSDIHHAYYIVSGLARGRDLLKIIYAEEPTSAIIFCNMRDETTMIAKYLQRQGLDAEPLSSDLSQADRERVMGRMKAKNLRFLCATDVAARGIDISDLSHVINFSVPESPEVYVHRTGRTGRAGKKGVALSMVGPRELGNFRYVRLQFGIKPEERMLPKDDIFEGKLKVPLPPVGTPQPPDPVQILIRGVQGQASDLERQIMEKLLKNEAGKRVLAKLVAERLDKLSTRAKPKRERSEGGEHEHHGERPMGGSERPSSDRPERSFDRGDRGPRPEGDRGPRPEGDRGPRPEGDRGDRPFGDRERRPFGDRDRGGERGDRPRFRDRDDRGPRPEGAPTGEAAAAGAPAADRPEGERGDRPAGERERRPFGDRDRGGDRGDRPRFRDRDDRGPRGDRPEGDRGPRGDRPEGDRGSRGDRPEGDRGPRGDRPEGERTSFGDRDRGGRDRFRDRDRGPRPDSTGTPDGTDPAPTQATQANGAVTATGPALDAAAEVIGAPTAGDRQFGDRGDRGGRDRDRGGRDRGGDRDGRQRRDWRDRNDRPAQSTDGAAVQATPTNTDGDEPTVRLPLTEVEATAVGTEAGPAVETETAPRVDDVARAALQRADRGGRDEKKGRGTDKKKAEPAGETREFWETWADEKSTRPAPVAPVAPAAAAPVADAGEAPAAAESDEGGRRGRSRGGRDRDRGGRDKKPTAAAKADVTTEAPAEAPVDVPADKPERAERGSKKAAGESDKPARGSKRDAAPAAVPAAAAADGTQARLFVSLGKKHGVSADDLRSLLAGAVGGDKERIGSVSLRDSHAHVRVPEALADQIIAGVHGTQHSGEEVKVERARA